MMKKMVIMAMIVGLASLATAGLESGVGPGSVDLVGGISSYAGMIVWTSPTLSGGTIALDPSVPTTFSNVEFLGTMGAGDLGLSYAGDVDVYGFAVAGDTNTALAAGAHINMVFAGFVFGDTDMGLGRIDALDGDTFAITSSIFVVPEPMTMALLGLGGLFLRRRK